MIDIVEYMGSTSSSGSCMDWKRRRLVDTEKMIDLKKRTCLSNPPKWHTSLKQHLNHVIEQEFKNPVRLNDVTHLLVESGYVGIIEVYNLAQTCKEMCKTTKRQRTWKSLCMQEFPSGTRQMPQIIIQEKGYKWLYHEWKSTIQSSEGRRKRAKVFVPLPPPRLCADQMTFCIHLNGQNDRPLHNVPIAMTGSDLAPLLNHGKMTHFFPEPVLVPIAKGEYNGQTASFTNELHVRIHILSISDASMCCVYNERMVLPWHMGDDAKFDDVNRRGFDAVQSYQPDPVESAGRTTFECHRRRHVDVGPADIATYHNCDVRLRDSSAASEIKQRLLCSTSIVFRVGLCLSDQSVSTASNQADHTNDTCFVSIAGLKIEVMKYDRLHNSCSPFDRLQMEDKNGGVTILHYLSEIQLS